MAWRVTSTQDEASWFSDYVRTALASPAPALPPHEQRIGAASATWFETEPGIAVIMTREGTVDDRMLAEIVVREQLRGHGIRQASFDLDWPDPVLRKEATWDDVMAKAKRLIQAGQVKILRNGLNNVVGHVQGDHGDYQTEIGRDDPNSRAITTWQCDCPWDQFAWQRTRQWKKYEGRVCSHVLATYWLSQQMPLDEDAHPSGGGGPNPQGSLFNMAPTAPSGGGGAPGGPAPAPQGTQMPLFNMAPGIMPPGVNPYAPVNNDMGYGAQGAPSGPDIMPPFPMDLMQQQMDMMPPVNPVSTPGGKPPSPLNPVQYPGGTFSHVAAQGDSFANGDVVQLMHEDHGTAMGRSDAHGSGQTQTIPANSIGEVLGQDPSTGLVDVMFTGPAAQNGPMEPYYVRGWFWASDLTPRPDIPKPGPAIRRRR